jgi:hypothetical protein
MKKKQTLFWLPEDVVAFVKAQGVYKGSRYVESLIRKEMDNAKREDSEQRSVGDDSDQSVS